MKVPFFDIKEQFAPIKEEIIESMNDILTKCSFVGGEYVETFEKELEDYLGVKHAVSCGSGTEALVLALRACDIGPGDEVITTSFSFFATAEAISIVGAKPVFADVQPSNLTISAYDIEELITMKTKAILPVHIFGHCCDMKKVMSVAKKHKLRVVEDCAQAIGAKHVGELAGTFGDIGCFSFYPTKNLGGAGDGGACVTNDPDLATMLRALKDHGGGARGKAAAELLYGQKLMDNGYDKYTNYLVGCNSRLDAFQAAVLSVKLRHLDEYNARRKEIADMYGEGLTDKVETPTALPWDEPCWHQYVIRTDKKEELCEHLTENDIGCGTFYPIPLHRQPAFCYLCTHELERSEKAAQQTVCLPIFPELTDQQVQYVIETVNRFFEGRDFFAHRTAEVSPDAQIGSGTKIWNHAQVREGASIGCGCNIGKNVYVDADVFVGNKVKIQNNVSLFHGLSVGDDVFIGPSVTFTNDMYPRSLSEDWQVVPTVVKKGASIGANSTIRCGVEIGEYAMIGCGSVVTKDVEPHALMVGNPAKRIGTVCECGYPVGGNGVCLKCGMKIGGEA